VAITPHTAGTWAVTDAAATATVTLPTHSTGDLLIVVGAQKAAAIASSNPTITTPATGWTRFLDGASGANNSGNGTGSVHMSVFWKIAASAADTNPVITWGNNSSPALVNAWSFTSGTGAFVDPVGVIKAGNVGTSVSITHDSNPGITAADLGLVILTMGDNNALTVPSWTATTAVLAAVVEYPAAAISSATGNDMAADAGYRIVSSGTATAAPVQTHTSAAADENIGAFVRIRELVITSASAEVASATGTSQAPLAHVATMGGLASATGTALQPTARGETLASAGLASATGTAQSPTASPAVQAEVAAASGHNGDVAQSPTAEIDAHEIAHTPPTSGSVATGAAHDATIQSSANAEAASAAGTAYDTAPLAEAFAAAGVGSATGTALDTTVTAAPFRDAAAEVASATHWSAEDATAAPAAIPGVAASLAAANDPTGAVAAMLGLASATGTAWDATATVSAPGATVTVDAEQASTTGTAWDATVTTLVTPPSSGGGVRRRRQSLIGFPVVLPQPEPVMVRVYAQVATATGTAHGASIEWNDDGLALLLLL